MCPLPLLPPDFRFGDLDAMLTGVAGVPTGVIEVVDRASVSFWSSRPVGMDFPDPAAGVDGLEDFSLLDLCSRTASSRSSSRHGSSPSFVTMKKAAFSSDLEDRLFEYSALAAIASLAASTVAGDSRLPLLLVLLIRCDRDRVGTVSRGDVVIGNF